MQLELKLTSFLSRHQIICDVGPTVTSWNDPDDALKPHIDTSYSTTRKLDPSLDGFLVLDSQKGVVIWFSRCGNKVKVVSAKLLFVSCS